MVTRCTRCGQPSGKAGPYSGRRAQGDSPTPGGATAELGAQRARLARPAVSRPGKGSSRSRRENAVRCVHDVELKARLSARLRHRQGVGAARSCCRFHAAPTQRGTGLGGRVGAEPQPVRGGRRTGGCPGTTPGSTLAVRAAGRGRGSGPGAVRCPGRSRPRTRYPRWGRGPRVVRGSSGLQGKTYARPGCPGVPGEGRPTGARRG